MTEDVQELAVDVGAEALEHVEQQARRRRSPTSLARLNPRTTVRKGEPIELVVDTHRLHFFDPDDGTGIYGRTQPDTQANHRRRHQMRVPKTG